MEMTGALDGGGKKGCDSIGDSSGMPESEAMDSMVEDDIEPAERGGGSGAGDDIARELIGASLGRLENGLSGLRGSSSISLYLDFGLGVIGATRLLKKLSTSGLRARGGFGDVSFDESVSTEGRFFLEACTALRALSSSLLRNSISSRLGEDLSTTAIESSGSTLLSGRGGDTISSSLDWAQNSGVKGMRSDASNSTGRARLSSEKT